MQVHRQHVEDSIKPPGEPDREIDFERIFGMAQPGPGKKKAAAAADSPLPSAQ